jgi:hypothetical protein
MTRCEVGGVVNTPSTVLTVTLTLADPDSMLMCAADDRVDSMDCIDDDRGPVLSSGPA